MRTFCNYAFTGSPHQRVVDQVNCSNVQRIFLAKALQGLAMIQCILTAHTFYLWGVILLQFTQCKTHWCSEDDNLTEQSFCRTRSDWNAAVKRFSVRSISLSLTRRALSSHAWSKTFLVPGYCVLIIHLIFEKEERHRSTGLTPTSPTRNITSKILAVLFLHSVT